MGGLKIQVADFIQNLLIAGSCVAKTFKDVGNSDLKEMRPYLHENTE